jgi:hypothetical protein
MWCGGQAGRYGLLIASGSCLLDSAYRRSAPNMSFQRSGLIRAILQE